MLRADDLLLVGVSGGPDSLCLLHLLHHLNYPVIAVHINHRLRPEADNEAQVVKKFSQQLGIDCITCQVDVQTYAQDKSISIEEAARTLRYDSLFEQAKALKANAVVVGHNADDQVETILMHLLRGSGLAGLRGIEFRTLPNTWSDDIPLLRPLLSTWRADIQKYIDIQNLNPITDQSNLETRYFRNRIRHELLPILESYNPSIREALLRMGFNLKDDYLLIQNLTHQAWEAALIRQGDGYLLFRTASLLSFPVSIQRYLLRMAIAYHLPSLRDVGFDCIDRGLGLLKGNKTNSQTDLIAEIRLIKEGGQFWVISAQIERNEEDFPAISTDENQALSIPSTLILNNRWELLAERVLNPNLIELKKLSQTDPFQVWMDIGKLDQPLIVRTRRPGDVIKPIGLNGHSIKLSDLMINQKLPKRARLTWPIVCSGEEILWVPGCRLSEQVRINQDSHEIIHLVLSRKKST